MTGELRQNVKFDLDGTLVDLRPIFERELDRMYGVQVQPSNHFHITTFPTQLTNSEIWRVFKSAYKFYKEIPVKQGATELLTKLYEITGQPPTIVTARSNQTAAETHKLIDRFLKVPYQVAFSNGGINKAAHLNNVDYFVDDRRRTALQLSYNGKFVYMPRNPYNHMNFNVPYIQYIDGVHELIPIIEDLLKVEVRYG
jgi:phosphoglycolate phosphatase-like HAD superfamily hydrolase